MIPQITSSAPAFPSHVAADLLSLIIGPLLGTGTMRTVYECAYDTRKVVKVATDIRGITHNVQEFTNYEQIPNDKRQYFAQVFSMSDGGHIIIQERVDPCPVMSEVRMKLPSFNDVKRWNVGLNSEGNYVICDIGFNMLDTELPLRDYVILQGEAWPATKEEIKARGKK